MFLLWPNAVESYHHFGRPANRQPLKPAMMIIYKEDMAKTLEIIAQRQPPMTVREHTE